MLEELPRRSFAPLLKTEPEPSFRLKLVSGYFTLMGGLGLVTVGSVLIGALAGILPRRVVFEHPIALLSASIMFGALLVTGSRLRDRDRSAWRPALMALAVPVLQSLASGRISAGDIAISWIAMLLLFSIRRELKD